ncbi:MAG: hypothetical protein IBJ04_01630 [Hydrogenophaga sp.]|uniref:hypothetical protein n=1 Tax=Hydrogenophaga sp. TaxID=1904254 RepID=UPI00257DCF12|nr:hypothetical protein [Hydrogenophaga sp.]MBL0943015.1 hypothetical protein [Hydrogenophaga sp.]
MKASSSRAPIVTPADISIPHMAQWLGDKAGRKPDARLHVKRNGQGANVVTTGGGAIRRLQVALGRRAPDRTDRESRAVVNNLLAAAMAHPAIEGLRNNLKPADRQRASAVRNALKALQDWAAHADAGPLRVSDLAAPLQALSEAIQSESAAATQTLLQRSLDAQTRLRKADIRDETDFARTAGSVALNRAPQSAQTPARVALKEATALAQRAQLYFIKGETAPQAQRAGADARHAVPELSRARFLLRLGQVVRRSPTSQSVAGLGQSTALRHRHPTLDLDLSIGMAYLLAIPQRLSALNDEARTAMQPLQELANAVKKAEKQAAKREAKRLAHPAHRPDEVAAANRELAKGCQQAVKSYEEVLAKLHALAKELLTLQQADPALADAGCARLQAMGCAVLGMVHALTAPDQQTAQLYRLARLGADDPAKARRAMQLMLRLRAPASAGLAASNASAAAVADTAPVATGAINTGDGPNALPQLPGTAPETADDTSGDFDAASAAIGWPSASPLPRKRPLSARHFEWLSENIAARQRRPSSGNHKIVVEDLAAPADPLQREREAGTVALNGDPADQAHQGDFVRARETALALGEATARLAIPAPTLPRDAGKSPRAALPAKPAPGTRTVEEKLDNLRLRLGLQQNALAEARAKAAAWRSEHGKGSKRLNDIVRAAEDSVRITLADIAAQEKRVEAARPAEDDELDQLLADINQRQSQPVTAGEVQVIAAAEEAHREASARLVELDQLRIATERIAAHDNQVSTDWTTLHGERSASLRKQADASLNWVARVKQQHQDQQLLVEKTRQALASAPASADRKNAAPRAPISQTPLFETEVQRANHDLLSLRAQLTQARALAHRKAGAATADAVALLETRVDMTQNRLREIELARAAVLARTSALNDPTRGDEAKVIELRVKVDRAEADVAQLRLRRKPFERAHEIAVEAHNREQKSGESRLQQLMPGKLEAIQRAQTAMDKTAAALRAMTRQLQDAEARLQANEQDLQAARSAQAARAPARLQSPANTAGRGKPATANAAFEALDKALNGTDDDWTAWVEASTTDVPQAPTTPPDSTQATEVATAPSGTAATRDDGIEPIIPMITERDEAAAENLIRQHSKLLLAQQTMIELDRWIERSTDQGQLDRLRARRKASEEEWSALVELSLPDALPTQEPAIMQLARDAARQQEAAAQAEMDALSPTDPTYAQALADADTDRQIARNIQHGLSAGDAAEPDEPVAAATAPTRFTDTLARLQRQVREGVQAVAAARQALQASEAAETAAETVHRQWDRGWISSLRNAAAMRNSATTLRQATLTRMKAEQSLAQATIALGKAQSLHDQGAQAVERIRSLQWQLDALRAHPLVVEDQPGDGAGASNTVSALQTELARATANFDALVQRLGA